MDAKEIKRNAEFIINELPGKKIPGKVVINCRYRNLVNFAKLYGFTDPKYIGSEEDGIIAVHSFANVYTIKSLYKLIIGVKFIQDGKERPILLNTNKMLHAGNVYDWEGCIDVKNGDKLTCLAKWGKFWFIEENQMLFGNIFLNVKNQNEELVCKVTIRVGIRPGGY